MKDFPVLLQDHSPPESVPWALVEAARLQIERNHGQTLERLAERGGLSYRELYCGVKGLSLSAMYLAAFPSTELAPFVIKGMVAVLQGVTEE